MVCGFYCRKKDIKMENLYVLYSGDVSALARILVFIGTDD